MANAAVEARLYSRVKPVGDCLIWQGAKVGKGYGQFRVAGKKVYVHRWVYENANGPIPDGLEIDHTCRNRACARLRHLEAVTHQENCARGHIGGEANRRKTHCPQGHSYSGSNLYIRPNGWRGCRKCNRHGR